MRTVVVGPCPPEIEDLLERRRRAGLDLFDEVWEGDYHMAPAPHRRHGQVDFQLTRILGPRADAAGLYGSGPCNIGASADYRVPDQAYFSDTRPETYNATAEVVVEIVSPGDESRSKFDFYFTVGVTELIVVDPELRTVECFMRRDNCFVPSGRSDVLSIDAIELTGLVDWPA